MHLHEIESLHHWYCTLPALVVGLIVMMALGKLTQDWQLLDELFPNRDIHISWHVLIPAMVGTGLFLWFFGYLLLSVMRWVFGEFPASLNVMLFYIFYAIVCIGPFWPELALAPLLIYRLFKRLIAGLSRCVGAGLMIERKRVRGLERRLTKGRQMEQYHAASALVKLVVEEGSVEAMRALVEGAVLESRRNCRTVAVSSLESLAKKYCGVPQLLKVYQKTRSEAVRASVRAILSKRENVELVEFWLGEMKKDGTARYDAAVALVQINRWSQTKYIMKETVDQLLMDYWFGEMEMAGANRYHAAENLGTIADYNPSLFTKDAVPGLLTAIRELIDDDQVSGRRKHHAAAKKLASALSVAIRGTGTLSRKTLEAVVALPVYLEYEGGEIWSQGVPGEEASSPTGVTWGGSVSLRQAIEIAEALLTRSE